MSKDRIRTIFNRHIGRVLTYLDSANVNQDTKQLVKMEMWQCHDDILQIDMFSELGEDNEAKNYQS